MNNYNAHFFLFTPSSYSEFRRKTDIYRLITLYASRGGHKVIWQYLGRHPTQPGHGSDLLRQDT